MNHSTLNLPYGSTMHTIVIACYFLSWMTFSCCNIPTISSLNTIRPIASPRRIQPHDCERNKRSNPSWIFHTIAHNAVNGVDGDDDSIFSKINNDKTDEGVTSNEETETSNMKTTTTTENMKMSNPAKKRRVAILVCPAQFCVPADYERLFTVLRDTCHRDMTIGTCDVCNLPRTEWIKVAQQLPTMNFVKAELPVEPTLYWYFKAIESSLNNIIASEQLYRASRNVDQVDDDSDFSICVIGHSIGGWVARAYLGGLSLSSSALYTYAKQHISSFITLGTPHISPSTALVDQTRGLLAAIESAMTCTPQALIETSSNYRNEPLEITCVGSSAIAGNFFTTNVEELVAASSYLPLTGKANGVIGDGIVPLELAFLDHPAKRIEIRACRRTEQPIRHCHVLPTPWNLIDGYAPSIALPSDTFPSYISDGVVQQWAHCIR